MIKYVYNVLLKAIELIKADRKAAVEKYEKLNIAKMFNDRYTYRLIYDTTKPRLTQGSAMYGMMPSGGHAWMCPECNKIHFPYESSVFDGLHYPRCCSTFDGNRLSRDIRTS